MIDLVKNSLFGTLFSPSSPNLYEAQRQYMMMNACPPLSIRSASTLREMADRTRARIKETRRDLSALEVSLLNLLALDASLTDEYGPESQ